MTDNCIYGVDMTKEVTPMMVRDALIDCFTLAHEEILNLMKEYSDFKNEEELQNMKKMSVRSIVRLAFSQTGGDFQNPTKGSILNALPKLQEAAAKFRKPEIIQKHTSEIMTLIERLK